MQARSAGADAAGSAAKKRRLAFKGPLNGPAVLLALRATTALYLCVPAFVVAGFFYQRHVRSYAALDLGGALILAIVALNVVDVVRLARNQIGQFSAGKAFGQTCLGIVGYGALAAGAGVHGGAALLLPILPFLVVALFGDLAIIALAWGLLVATLAVAVGLQAPAAQTAWLTIIFGLTALSVCLMIHVAVSDAIATNRLGHSLATVAADTGLLRAWPDDLAALAPRLAEAMDVRSYAVFSRVGTAGDLAMAFFWPAAAAAAAERAGGPDPPDTNGTGPAAGTADDGLAALAGRALAEDGAVTDGGLAALAGRALAEDGAVTDGGSIAVRALAGAATVVVVIPSRSRRRVPPDLAPARIVAASLASMLDRSVMVAALEYQARTDDLTGLANRRALHEMLLRELAVHKRSGKPLALAVLDLDHFKSYNDRFGHAAGDELLRCFGQMLRQRIRQQDLATRFGGEEFVIVLPGTDIGGGADLIEELRSSGAGQDPEGSRVSFSAGVTIWDGEETADELITRADNALYAAKKGGRDQLVVGG